MAFNSYTFLLFFAGLLVLHYLPLPWRLKKFNLLWASYLFYAAWNPPFVVLLWISTVVDWFAAKGIYRFAQPFLRRPFLFLSLGVNLGMLGFFKYGGFLLDNFVQLVNMLGIQYVPAKPDIIVPVGISFYTFQTLSYTLDIYLGKARPAKSFLDYALYVTFFPQLVAGPIVRASRFLPQCVELRRATGRQFAWGLNLFVIGLFEKIVVADGLLAPVVDKVYDPAVTPGMLAAWIGTVGFAGQIFCDFAGYSTCAIGVAMCLGFSIPDNFRFPYAATGFSDFWHRWHISLSTWLRDYLYIPLGGNRRGTFRTHLNVMFTMLLGGLWHGASWTFVVWGALHGIYLSAERALRRLLSGLSVWHRPPVKLALVLLTFGLICLGWVFFRCDSLPQAVSMASTMLGLESGGSQAGLDKKEILFTALTVASILIVHWRMRDTTIEAVAEKRSWLFRSLLIATMLVAIATMPGEDRAFIYFQF